MCNDPAPSVDGKPCAGEATEQVKCHVTPCPGEQFSNLFSGDGWAGRIVKMSL